MADEVVGLEERVANAIKLGESHFREFKSAWVRGPSAQDPRDPREIAKDVAETLVAFANADGGELLVGVEDDGGVSGVPHRDAVLEALTRAPAERVLSSTPLPRPLISRVSFQERTLLYFAVEKGTKFIHLTSDGRCLQRRDRENVPTPVEKIEFERQERASREYDREYVEGASVADLDSTLVDKVAAQLAAGTSNEKALQLLSLADFDGRAVRLRRAALLLFARDVARWHPRCGVRLLRIRGTELLRDTQYNATKDEVVTANVLELISKAWDVVRPELMQVRRIGGLFEEQTLYPEEACFEALVNAVAHRDYSIEGRLIEVFVYDDRMEFRSPGNLLSTVAVEGLREQRGLHESRNVFVARVLRELGYMREVGEGMRRIFRLMRSKDLVPPELRVGEGSFGVVLRHTSAFSAAEQAWLQLFERIPLSRDERLVVLLGRPGAVISPQEIWDALEIVDTEDYRKVLRSLQQKGILISRIDSNAATERGKTLGIPRRQVPRFVVRPPKEVERLRSELLEALSHLSARSRLGAGDYLVARAALPDTSPYKNDISRSMQLLGLADAEGIPSEELIRLWQQAPAKPQPYQPELVEAAPVPTDVDTGAEDLEEVNVAGTIVLRGLPFGMTPSEIYDTARAFGPIRFVSIPLDVFTGRPRGIGLLQMRDPAAQGPAMRALRSRFFRGRKLTVDWEPIGTGPSPRAPESADT